MAEIQFWCRTDYEHRILEIYNNYNCCHYYMIKWHSFALLTEVGKTVNRFFSYLPDHIDKKKRKSSLFTL
jgi:hypothetical protein